MRNLAVLVIHLIVTLARLLGPGGVHRCGVAAPQTPTPGPEPFPATIAESIRVGPHSCRLDGTVAATNSPAPFCN